MDASDASDASDAGRLPQDPVMSGDRPAVAQQVSEAGNETLILDAGGVICACGAAAERLFGTSQSRLIGRRIPEFIVGILFEGNSPSENARQLNRLCAESRWQAFEAMDARGTVFAVEIHLSRKMTTGQEVFVLGLRRP